MASQLKVDQLLNSSGGTFDGSQLGNVGKVLQVKHVNSSATRYTISAQELTSIPELSITFTKLKANSSLLLLANIASSATHVASYGFQSNGSNLGGSGNTNVSSGAIATQYWGTSTEDYMEQTSYLYLYSNGPTTATYTATAASSWNGSLYNLYINDRVSNDMRSTSTFTIMEIGA